MIRRARPTLFLVTAAVAVLITCRTTVALADEEDDIQRQIDTQKAGVPDLEHLDTRRAATADIQRLREWLNLAWDLRNKHDTDAAREVLDRCLAQSELIRQIIAASQLKAEVSEKEAKLKRTREEIDRQKQALQQAQVNKASLERGLGS